MSERDTTAGFDEGALRAEIACYRRLLEVLGAEQEALSKADADALPDIATAKQREVHALGRFATARSGVRQVCANAGFSTWDELRDLAARAQRINAANGLMIHARQVYVDRALCALHGAAGRSPVYGADGRPRFQSSGIGSFTCSQ